MSKKLVITDVRAVRSKLEPHEFAVSEGQDAAPSDLVEEEVWGGMHGELTRAFTPLYG